MKVKLGEVCVFQRGQSITKKDIIEGDIPVVAGGQTPAYYHNKANREKNIITISSSGYAGYVNFWTVPIFCSDSFTVKPKDDNQFIIRYLYYFLKSRQKNIYSLSRGCGIKHIYSSDIAPFEIELVDIQTQKEIVAVLDKVTSLISIRKEQLEKLDILVKSKFIEMFGDPVLNPKGWEKKKWNDVFITTTGKRNSNEMVEFGQYPFFTCAKQIYYIDNYSFDCEALLLAGNNATADYDVKYYCGKFDAYQRTYVLTLKQNNSYKYFQYLLESKLSMMKNLSIGINTKYLTLKILNSIDFIIPPLDLQNQFAEFVEQVEKNKENIKSSLNQLETLYSALMQEYFG